MGASEYHEARTSKVIHTGISLAAAEPCILQAVRFFREVNLPGHGGRIFNMSSVAGYTGHAGIVFYSAGKFGALNIS